jgi:thiol-disulfide isomerase/thioredoxin
MIKISVAQKIVRIGLMLALAALATWGIWPKPVAPEVTLQIIGEGRVPLKAWRGKPVLVTFWATTCPVCLEEMPPLIAAYQKYHAAGFELVAVAMPYDPPDRVYHYMQQRGLPFKVALDIDGQVGRAFGDIPGTPTAFLIDRQGRMVEKRVGRLDFKALDTWLARE